MTYSHSTFVSLVVVALACSGCGDDDGPGPGSDAGVTDGGGGTGVPFDEIPARLAGTFCDQFEMCFGGAFAGLFFGAMDCEVFFARQLEDTLHPSWQAAVDGDMATYHGDRMEECIAALAALGCELFYSRLPDACQRALEGTVPIGGPCSETLACEGDAFCSFSGSCLMGTCASPAAAGSPCAIDDGCVTGTDCQNDVCTAPARMGESCGGGVAPECIIGMLCVGDDDTTMTPGSCTAAATLLTEAEGAPCNPDTGMLCQEGLACVVMGMSATCVTPAPDFGRCYVGFPDPCPRGQYCNAMVGDEGDCTALPASGSPCHTSPLPNAQCNDGLTCVSGTCLPIERLGESCSADTQCYSGNCDLMSCMLPNRCL